MVVVVVDFPAEYRAPIGDDPLPTLPTHFPSMRAMLDALAFVDEPLPFTESAVEEPEGWRFLWQADEIHAAKVAVRGDWWDDFTAAGQPLMAVRGGRSAVVPPGHAEEMVRLRPGTEVVTIDGHHDCYLTHQAELGATVRAFLDRTAPWAV